MPHAATSYLMFPSCCARVTTLKGPFPNKCQLTSFKMSFANGCQVTILCKLSQTTPSLSGLGQGNVWSMFASWPMLLWSLALIACESGPHQAPSACPTLFDASKCFTTHVDAQTQAMLRCRWHIGASIDVMNHLLQGSFMSCLCQPCTTMFVDVVAAATPHDMPKPFWLQ